MLIDAETLSGVTRSVATANRFMHESNGDSKHCDPADVIDGLAVWHQLKNLMHHKGALDPILQEQTWPRSVAAYWADSIAQRADVMKGSDLPDGPGSCLRLPPVKADSLRKRERTIGLASALTVDLESAAVAREKSE